MAFLLTESKFRSFLFRLGEVAYAAFLLQFLSTEPRLTLGTAQIAFRFWRQRYGRNNLRLLLATFSDHENYTLCCEFLRSQPSHSPHELITAYNGRPSLLYAMTFSENLKLCRFIAEHAFKPHSRARSSARQALESNQSAQTF
jgi:hypothetical protein